LFDTASAKLRPASYAVLSQIADALGRNRGWRLSIQGHTDSDGGAAYNLDLSQRRAASVKTALVTNFHVDPKRLQTQGFGLTRPVASNATDAGKQLNRRVELVRI
jgi:outer membrane protein OmpA-like peptidoglycan-associated protein